MWLAVTLSMISFMFFRINQTQREIQLNQVSQLLTLPNSIQAKNLSTKLLEQGV